MMKNVAPVSRWAVTHQVVEIGHPHRVEARVGLVEEHDLGLGHHGPGQAGPLLHAARDLAGQLLQVVHESDQLGVAQHDLTDLRLALAGVLTQREGDVVVEVHRPEQGAVLEQHAELPADRGTGRFPHAHDLLAVHPDLARVRTQQAEDVLEQHRLAGARGAEDGGDLALGDVEGDVLEHRVRPPNDLVTPRKRDDRLARSDPGGLQVAFRDRHRAHLAALVAPT